MYLYSYRVSIAAESVRCLTYILVVPSHRTSRQYQSGRRSAVWPSSHSRFSDRPYLYLLFLPWWMMSIYSNEEEKKGKMKTSSSKREQIDSDHLSSSFSRTIIWRCYRRRKKRERERMWTIWRRATDARATKTKHKREREKTTVTANHALMMYNNNRTPFYFFLSLVHICSSWP
jgi:hypothetical protein